MTVCSTSNLDEKCEWLKKKENTGVAVLNVSEFNLMSTESSDSEQHNEGSQGSGNRRGKRKANILAHQSDLYSFHLSLSQRWWYSMSSVLVEADFPVATGLWRMLSTQISADNPSRCS